MPSSEGSSPIQWVIMPSSEGSSPIQGQNPRLLHLVLCRLILYPLSHQKSPFRSLSSPKLAFCHVPELFMPRAWIAQASSKFMLCHLSSLSPGSSISSSPLDPCRALTCPQVLLSISFKKRLLTTPHVPMPPITFFLVLQKCQCCPYHLLSALQTCNQSPNFVDSSSEISANSFISNSPTSALSNISLFLMD